MLQGCVITNGCWQGYVIINGCWQGCVVTTGCWQGCVIINGLPSQACAGLGAFYRGFAEQDGPIVKLPGLLSAFTVVGGRW